MSVCVRIDVGVFVIGSFVTAVVCIAFFTSHDESCCLAVEEEHSRHERSVQHHERRVFL